MSYMADRDHIAITSGDASPTRRKVSVRDAQLLRPSLSLKVRLAILVVASRRIRNTVRQVFAGGLMKRRDRPVDAEIRGVSQHCRIVTYQNTAKAAVKITTSSLLSVTSRYGRVGLPMPLRAFQGPGSRVGARNTLGSDPGSTMNRDGMKESPP